MRDEDKWPAMHAYRQAVAMGDAPAILCPEDEAELVPVVGKNSLPALRCLSCGIAWEPGLLVWDQIRSNIQEVIRDIKEKEFED